MPQPIADCRWLILDFRTDATAFQNQIKNQQSALINRQSAAGNAEPQGAPSPRERPESDIVIRQSPPFFSAFAERPCLSFGLK